MYLVPVLATPEQDFLFCQVEERSMKDFDIFEWTLIIFGFLVPLVFYKKILGVFTVSITEVAVFFMGLAFLIKRSRRNLNLRLSVNDKIFLALVIWVGLSLPMAIDWTKSLREFLWILESFLIFYMISHADLKRSQVERLIRAWCYGAVVVSLIALLQYISAIQSGQGAIRVYAHLGNSNLLAGFLIVYLPIVVSQIYSKRKDQRVFWGVLATLVSTALFVTYTRGGWYAAIISILVLARLTKDKKLLIFLVVYLLIYNYTFPAVSGHKLTGLQNFDLDNEGKSLLYRIQLWRVAVQMWLEHPLIGVGVGNYYLLHDAYIAKFPWLNYGSVAMEPHNSFLKFLAEQGAIGLLLFFSLLLSLFKKLFERIRNNENEMKILSMGVFAGYMDTSLSWHKATSTLYFSYLGQLLAFGSF